MGYSRVPIGVTAVLALAATAAPALAADCAALTPLQTAAGFVTWLGVLRVLVVVCGVACVATLLLTWFRFLLLAFAAVPLVVYEVLGYGVSAALVASRVWLSPADAAWTVPIGAFLAGAVLLVAGMARRSKTPPSVTRRLWRSCGTPRSLTSSPRAR